MSTTVIGEKNKTRTGTSTIDESRRGAVRKKWSTVYYVSAALSDTEDDVLVTAGLPVLHMPYRNGFCISKAAREENVVASGALWEVTCEFDSHIEADIPVVETSWDIEEKEEVLQWDVITGKPILNSANEPIITEHPSGIPVLTISRVEATFSPSTILAYNNHVNSAPFYGAPIGCALMQGPKANKKIIDSIRMWEVQYVVKFNMRINPQNRQPLGWGLYLLDYGTRYIADREADGTPIYEAFSTDDDDSETVGQLDGHGNPLPANYSPVYLYYNRYPLANFSALGLE